MYYLIVITYRRGKGVGSRIKGSLECLLHALPISVVLIGTSTILAMDAFHPNMTYCRHDVKVMAAKERLKVQMSKGIGDGVDHN